MTGCQLDKFCVASLASNISPPCWLTSPPSGEFKVSASGEGSIAFLRRYTDRASQIIMHGGDQNEYVSLSKIVHYPQLRYSSALLTSSSLTQALLWIRLISCSTSKTSKTATLQVCGSIQRPVESYDNIVVWQQSMTRPLTDSPRGRFRNNQSYWRPKLCPLNIKLIN